MATFIKIIPARNIKLFDSPPVFTGEQRKQIFTINKWELHLLETFTNPTNKVGFILQLGYFRAVNKFYTNKKFIKKDIEYIARNLRINLKDIIIPEYKDRTFLRHQEIILDPSF